MPRVHAVAALAVLVLAASASAAAAVVFAGSVVLPGPVCCVDAGYGYVAAGGGFRGPLVYRVSGSTLVFERGYGFSNVSAVAVGAGGLVAFSAPGYTVLVYQGPYKLFEAAGPEASALAWLGGSLAAGGRGLLRVYYNVTGGVFSVADLSSMLRFCLDADSYRVTGLGWGVHPSGGVVLLAAGSYTRGGAVEGFAAAYQVSSGVLACTPLPAGYEEPSGLAVEPGSAVAVASGWQGLLLVEPLFDAGSLVGVDVRLLPVGGRRGFTGAAWLPGGVAAAAYTSPGPGLLLLDPDTGSIVADAELPAAPAAAPAADRATGLLVVPLSTGVLAVYQAGQQATVTRTVTVTVTETVTATLVDTVTVTRWATVTATKTVAVTVPVTRTVTATETLVSTTTATRTVTRTVTVEKPVTVARTATVTVTVTAEAPPATVKVTETATVTETSTVTVTVYEPRGSPLVAAAVVVLIAGAVLGLLVYASRTMRV